MADILRRPKITTLIRGSLWLIHCTANVPFCLILTSARARHLAFIDYIGTQAGTMDLFRFIPDQQTDIFGSENDSNETQSGYTESDIRALMTIATCVSLLGTFSNLMSLSYFFTHRSKKLGEKLIVLLNVLDFLVCLSIAWFYLFEFYIHNAPLVTTFLNSSYLVFVECTGFTTALLTVVRTIVTYRPFYNPNNKIVVASFVVFTTCVTFKGGLTIYFTHKTDEEVYFKFTLVYNCILVGLITADLLVVFIANLLTVCELLKPDRYPKQARDPCSTKRSRHATVTIFILSVLFGVLNLLYVVMLYNYVLGRETGSVFFRNLLASSAVPLNSALNPFVYFFRKTEMRRFFCRVFCRRGDSINSPDYLPSFSNIVVSQTFRDINRNQLYSQSTVSFSGVCPSTGSIEVLDTSRSNSNDLVLENCT